MSRGRVASRGRTSWPWAPIGLGLYVAGLGGLRMLGGGAPSAWPAWAGLPVAALAYALVALALMGPRAPARLLGLTVTATVAHAALVGAAPALSAWLPVAVTGGAGSVVVRDSVALTGLVAVCVALLTIPLGRLARPRPRTVRGAGTTGPRPVPRAQPQPAARTPAAPARVVPRRAEPGPVASEVATVEPPVPGAAPAVSPAAPSPARAASPAPAPSVVPARVLETPAAAGVAPVPAEPRPDMARPSRRVEPVPGPETLEEVVRISFDCVADQLPQDLFVLPRDRVAANLLEPGALLVPRRLVLPQLAEGAVRVPWSAVVDQFPGQAMAVSDSEVVDRLQDGTLELPLDELLAQLGPELFALASPVADVSDLENFPPPFQPHVPPPRSDAAAAAPGPVRRLEPPRQPAPARESDPVPPAEEVVASPAPSMATPEGLAARLAPVLGPLVITTRAIDSGAVPLFRTPGVDEDAVAETVGRIMPLVRDAPLAAPLRQVTLWGRELALVLTPLGPGSPAGPAVVMAMSRGAAVGLVERVVLPPSVAAAACPGGAIESGSVQPTTALQELTCPPEVRGLAGHLGGPGAVAPLVLRDQDGQRVYAFLSRGMPARALASLAARLHRLLDGAPIHVDTVALRVAACRVLSRRLGGEDGRGPLLVLGSVSIDRPGLARLELERIAVRLAAVVGA